MEFDFDGIAGRVEDFLDWCEDAKKKEVLDSREREYIELLRMEMECCKAFLEEGEKPCEAVGDLLGWLDDKEAKALIQEKARPLITIMKDVRRCAAKADELWKEYDDSYRNISTYMVESDLPPHILEDIDESLRCIDLAWKMIYGEGGMK